MSRQSTPPVQPADPLADLREDAPAGPPAPEVVEDAAPFDVVGAIVAEWHSDTTAQGFAHKGGACGCRYLALGALRAAGLE